MFKAPSQQGESDPDFASHRVGDALARNKRRANATIAASAGLGLDNRQVGTRRDVDNVTGPEETPRHVRDMHLRLAAHFPEHPAAQQQASIDGVKKLCGEVYNFEGAHHGHVPIIKELKRECLHLEHLNQTGGIVTMHTQQRLPSDAPLPQASGVIYEGSFEAKQAQAKQAGLIAGGGRHRHGRNQRGAHLGKARFSYNETKINHQY